MEIYLIAHDVIVGVGAYPPNADKHRGPGASTRAPSRLLSLTFVVDSSFQGVYIPPGGSLVVRYEW